MDEYELIFAEDWTTAGLMSDDAETLGHGSKACRGAYEYNHGFWVAFDDYPTACQVADNFASELFRVNARSEIIVECRDGTLAYIGQVVLRNKTWCIESGDWLTDEGNYFCLNFE